MTHLETLRPRPLFVSRLCITIFLGPPGCTFLYIYRVHFARHTVPAAPPCWHLLRRLLLPPLPSRPGGSLGCEFNPGTYLGLPSRGRDRAASPAPPGIYDLSCKHEINSLLIVLSSVQTVISMVNERALLCELRRPAGLWPRELLRISIMVRALSQPASLIQAALMAGAQTSK